MNFDELRNQLVESCLKWESLMGVMPRITGAISEYDAMKLMGMSQDQIFEESEGKTAVQKGHDFIFNNIKYQVKANRPSGKKGSSVTLTSKAKNYEFDKLIWILYNSKFVIQEAYICDVKDYKEKLGGLNQVRPNHLREVGELISVKKTV
jgi:hypothetical protein